FLSDTSLHRTSHGNMTLSGIQNANLTGGASANTFTVQNWSGIATLDGKEGSDTYNLTLSGTGTGTVNVSDSGSTGTDTMNVTGSGTTLVTSTSVRVGTQRANYGTSGIELLNVIGGKSNLTYNVQSTNATVNTTVQPTGNSNVITVSSTAGVTPFKPGNLDGILGGLPIPGGAGVNNLRRVSDQAGVTSKTVTLTNHSIVGMAPAEIDYSVTTGNFTDGSAADGIKLQSSSSAATIFNIQSTLAGSTTETDGGSGNDTFNVWQTVAGVNNVAGILGMLTIAAGGGAANRLIVDNSGATADQTVTLKDATAAGYKAITGLASAEIDYKSSGAFADPTPNSSDGIRLLVAGTKAAVGSTVNIQTTLAGSTTKVIGGNGNDTFNVWQTVAGPLNNVARILGMLTIDAGGGAANRLI